MIDTSLYLPLLAGTFLVAMLYSSVGHGGASGYLAVLSFFAVSPQLMSSSALVLNLLVAGISFYAFFKAACFSWRLTWPFAVTSIPAAFLGGLIELPRAVYSFMLIVVFLFAAFRLWFHARPEQDREINLPPVWMAAMTGVFLGLLSGMIGVGGGIFLSPLLLLLGWAGAKQTAATSAFFIWVNSIAGLLGRSFGGQLGLPPFLLPMAGFALAGSLIGSGLGSRIFTPLVIRRTLAFTLMIATVKLMLTMS